jgi:hypothetical protein
MRPCAFARPSDAGEAVRAVAGDPEVVFLAGGTNLVDHLRLGVARPALVVDVRTLTSREITGTGDGGLQIGAAVTNSEPDTTRSSGPTRHRTPPPRRRASPRTLPTWPLPWPRSMHGSSCADLTATGKSSSRNCAGCPAAIRRATPSCSTAS